MFDHVSIGVVRQRFFGIPATDTDIISAQHFWTGGLETAGSACYDAGAIGRNGGFPNAGYEPHPSCGDCPLTAEFSHSPGRDRTPALRHRRATGSNQQCRSVAWWRIPVSSTAGLRESGTQASPSNARRMNKRSTWSTTGSGSGSSGGPIPVAPGLSANRSRCSLTHADPDSAG